MGLAESGQSYVRGVALSREPPKLQQPLLVAWHRHRALLPSYDTRFWRAELGMRDADLLRDATAGIGRPASAPCMILQCGTWYGCVAVWPCGCVFSCGGMSNAIGSENTCKTFRLSFSTEGSSLKSRVLQLDPPVGILGKKKMRRKKPFPDCVRKPDLGFSRKRLFSTNKSDCIRNSIIRPFS